MSKWTYTRSVSTGGRFQILITKPGRTPVDVTFFRGVPTLLQSYTVADPFGDSTAVIEFPQLTAFEDLGSQEIGSFLGDYSDVDIWWIPATTLDPNLIAHPPAAYAQDLMPWVNPLTNQPDLYAPAYNYTGSGSTWTRGTHRGTKVWEGFIASMELNSDQNSNSIQVQCQGALYQADRYLEKPFYPGRPQTLESLIQAVFDHTNKPHLRTQPVRILWPAGWSKIGPPYPPGGANTFTPNITPGVKWTGYSTRSTGSWDHSLTSFVQDNLAVMLTQDDSGVTPGNQWTLMMAREGGQFGVGRAPYLTVRDRFAAPNFSLWTGTPGVTMSLTRDTTQMANIIYGDGTGVDGTVWRNAVVSADGSRTDYLPLASSTAVYPSSGNPNFNKNAFVSESYVKYGTGFNQVDATHSAEKTLQRDLDPGWNGTMTLAVDPSPSLSKYQIQPGMVVNVKGLIGTGDTGINFHIASVDVSPQDNTVSLTIDTRFRDLLNLEEAMARSRDPLTPAKLLQVNRASAAVEDVQAPWDYTAGSGFIPKASTAFDKYRPASVTFPYASYALSHPPFHFSQFYVTCHASATTRKGRWAGPIPVLMSEKGTISRTEVCAYDIYGRVVKVPFHFSLYYVNVTPSAMPTDGNGPSPFITGAFESINPATGQPWPAGNFLAPDPSMIIGWGNYQQRAGFSPGRQSDGNGPTGMLVDDSTWTFDCTNNPNYNKLAKPGQKQAASAVTIYAMFYAEYTSTIYFKARLFRQAEGAA